MDDSISHTIAFPSFHSISFYVYPPIGFSHPSTLAPPPSALAPVAARTSTNAAARTATAGSTAAATMPPLVSPGYQMYPGTPNYSFALAQHMMTRIPGPYTAAQQPTTVVYPIPPAATSQPQGMGTAKQSTADAAEEETKQTPGSSLETSKDATQEDSDEGVSGSCTGAEDAGEITTQATANAVSIE